MIQNKTSAFVILGLVGALGASDAAATDPQAPPQLSGTWKLNRELSESPGQKLMEAMRGADGPGERGRGGPGGGGSGMGGRGGGGGGGMGPGGGGRGGGMGGPSGRGPGRGARGGMLGAEPPLDGAPAMDRPIPSPQFTIEQEGESLAFRTENNLRILRSDGQKRKKEGEAGKIEVTARFLKGTLVVLSRPEMGGKRKETYTLRPDGRLEIDFEIDASGPMPGLKFKLVYDAAPVA